MTYTHCPEAGCCLPIEHNYNETAHIYGVVGHNPNNRYDERTAVAEYGDTLDEVRANGLLSVCLGCGTTTACDPMSREANRAAIDWDTADCCPGADRVNY